MGNNNQPQSDWQKRELGALWTKVSKNGAKYLRGKLKLETGDINVMVFPTKEKRNENSPDFVIYLDDSASRNASGGSAQSAATPQQPRRTNYQPRQQRPVVSAPGPTNTGSTEQFL